MCLIPQRSSFAMQEFSETNSVPQILCQIQIDIEFAPNSVSSQLNRLRLHCFKLIILLIIINPKANTRHSPVAHILTADIKEMLICMHIYH